MRATHRLALLGAALGFALPPAAARARSNDELEAARKPRPHASAVVLLDMNDAVRADRAEGGVFRIRKRYGFEYVRDFRVADHPYAFSVQGPALPRKRLGLTFEFRF